MRFKIIQSGNLEKLEREINKFIKDEQVRDIQYLQQDSSFLAFILVSP